jgi:hypothetical protein
MWHNRDAPPAVVCSFGDLKLWYGWCHRVALQYSCKATDTYISTTTPLHHSASMSLLEKLCNSSQAICQANSWLMIQQRLRRTKPIPSFEKR